MAIQIQDIIVYVIGVVVLFYIAYHIKLIFNRASSQDSKTKCAGCEGCSIKDKVSCEAL